MSKRRTDQEIREVEAIHRATADAAYAIGVRVNGDDVGDTYVRVAANNLGNLKAEFQRDGANVIIVSFNTRDAALAERVALSIKAAVMADVDKPV